jgi:hypothetical protein
MSVGRKLKNFSAYKKRILLYAQANGISVVYNADKDDEGVWLPSVRRIKIYPDLAPSTEIATLLHECGHALDDAVTDDRVFNKLCNAYQAFYINRARKEQRSLVIESEIRAWELGRRIAKALKIRAGRWYALEQESAIQAYRKETHK